MGSVPGLRSPQAETNLGQTPGTSDCTHPWWGSEPLEGQLEERVPKVAGRPEQAGSAERLPVA